MNIFETKVVSNEMLTGRVFETVLEYSSTIEFEFKPGQFIMVHVNDEVKPPIRRAYSIVNPPSEHGIFRIWTEYVEGLKGPEFLRGLKEDETCPVSGPYGNFTLRESDRPILLIATGTGVAPFYSMIADALENNDSRQIELVFGVRHQEDFFGYNTFKSWDKTYDNFTFYPTLTKPNGDFEGARGRVTKIVPEEVKNLKDKSIYICGSPKMVTDMQNVLIELGCMQAHVHFEKY